MGYVVAPAVARPESNSSYKLIQGNMIKRLQLCEWLYNYLMHTARLITLPLDGRTDMSSLGGDTAADRICFIYHRHCNSHRAKNCTYSPVKSLLKSMRPH